MQPQRLRLFITCDLPGFVQQRLERSFAVTQAPAGFRLTAQAPLHLLEGHECLFVSATRDRLDRTVIAALPPSLRAIATYSVGHEHIDLEAARERGMAVFHTPDVLSGAVAEVAMLLLLGAARRATESIDLLRSGRWTGWSPTQLNGLSLAGKRLGIVGMGRIGQEIAARALAFGMRIHYNNRSRLELELEAGAVFHAARDDLLRASDFLVLACPVTPETRGLLDARGIALLPQSPVVTNVGRGALIVDEDLVAALRSGRVFAAGLDVFNGEPDIHPAYAALPNVFMLPHVGSSTVEARLAMAEILLAGIEAWQVGRVAANRLV